MVILKIFILFTIFLKIKVKKVKEVIINKNDSGQRLDKFLQKFMPKIPKSMLYKGIRKNAVRINGKHAKSGDVFLEEGDVLKLYFKDEFFSEGKTVKAAGEPDVVYEDENILILNKPQGLPVHDDEQKTEDTLIARVLYYLLKNGEYNPKEEKSFSPALCNRLDRNTSGLVIAAKNAEALRFINEKIRLREIKKYYVCMVEGMLEDKKGVLTGNLKRGDKRVSITEKGDGKEIVTAYEVLEEDERYSKIKVELITGRTHQIRAHFAHLGHPLRGDTKYGAKPDKDFKFQALCSYLLKFDFKTDNEQFKALCGKSFEIKPPF